MKETTEQATPKVTPKPRDPRALSAYRHGLTGQIHILTAADQVAYDKHCHGYHESLAPVGMVEADLVQSIAEERWRLKRASALESAIFADGLTEPDRVTSGNPEIDTALAQGRIWLAKGGNLQLLTLYESRIQRRFEKNMAELRLLQAERRAALDRAVDEHDHLAELALSKGEVFDPKDFPREALPANFVFSTAGIVRLIAHRRRLAEAGKLAVFSKTPPKMAA